MPRRAWAELLALSALWGSSYLFISVALRDVGPAFLAFVRVAGAAVVLLPLTWRHRSALSGRWRYLPLVGLFQVAVPFVLISAGERHIDSGLAGTLVATAPLWLVVLGPLLAVGRPTVLALVGTVVGLVGVALLLGGIGTGSAVDLGGSAMVVAAAMSYAVALVLVRRLMRGVHATALTGATMAAAALLLVPPAALDVPARMPGWTAGGALLALAIACTAGAFVLYNRLIAEVGPQRASLVAYLAPVFAIGYGAALLDEPLGIGTFAGLALILGGSWACSRPARTTPGGGEHEGTVRTSKVKAG